MSNDEEQNNEIYIPGSEIKKVHLKTYRATCKITVTFSKNKEKGYGTGFFMKININNYLLKCLITAEHNLVNEEKEKENGKIEDIIKIDYDDETFEIQLDKKKRFIKGFNLGYNRENHDQGEKIDVLLIEIIDEDNVKDKYFLTEYINKEEIKQYRTGQGICVVQFPEGRYLGESIGTLEKIIDKGFKFEHKASTKDGSSGSPIFLEDTDKVIGIHIGGVEAKTVNNGIFFYQIFPYLERDDNLIEKFKQNLNDNDTEIEINLIYNRTGYGQYANKIFGNKFINNNRNKIKEFYVDNIKQRKLVDNIQLNERVETNIKIKVSKKLTNLSYMFYNCESLINIKELSKLNTNEVNDFSYLFSGCKKLSNIESLQKWDVSKGTNFSHTFYGCSKLQNIKPLENLDFSKGEDFSDMFKGCSISRVQKFIIEKIVNKSNTQDQGTGT